jgi:hypothetical protein
MLRNFVSVLYGISLPANITSGNNGFLFCVVWKDKESGDPVDDLLLQ